MPKHIQFAIEMIKLIVKTRALVMALLVILETCTAEVNVYIIPHWPEDWCHTITKTIVLLYLNFPNVNQI